MSILLALLLQHARQSDPVPTDPVPMPDPFRVRSRCQTRRRTKNRLNCRIEPRDLRGYAPSDRKDDHEIIVTAFSTLNVLPAAQLDNLNELGYLTMTPVQAAALPAILEGRDVRVQAKTGSGKRQLSVLVCCSILTRRCFRPSHWSCARPASWQTSRG